MVRSILTIIAAMILLPGATRAQTVDEIIAKNIQAHGGMEKLASIQSMRSTGIFSAGSFHASVMQENKRPDKVRQNFTIQGLTQIQAFDGKTGWQVNPFGGRMDAELLSQDDMKDLVIAADIDGPLVNYQQKGSNAELLGHDDFEGTDCYKIKLTLKNGDIRTYYLDADSYLELKVETQTMIRGAIQENETYYGDYMQVDGIYFPFAMESGPKGSTERTKITVEKIELNVPLDDALFSVPAAPAEGKTPSGN
jgi:outer membrane lipoprotein-sorting protein